VDFEDEIQRVAHWIADVIDAKCAEEVVQRVRELVLKLCRRFPVYVAKARQ
jgi:glycine/serine hydroxymethyltransferase